MRRTVLLLVLATLLLVPQTEARRPVSELYVGSGSVAAVEKVAGCDSRVHLSRACFHVLPGETAVTVYVDDESKRVLDTPVAGRVRFWSGATLLQDAGVFCIQRLMIPIPEGATTVEVAPVLTLQDTCGPRIPSPGTAGTIYAVFW